MYVYCASMNLLYELAFAWKRKSKLHFQERGFRFIFLTDNINYQTKQIKWFSMDRLISDGSNEIIIWMRNLSITHQNADLSRIWETIKIGLVKTTVDQEF